MSVRLVLTRFAPMLLTAMALSLAGCAGTRVGEVTSQPAGLAASPPKRIEVVVEDVSRPSKKASRLARQAADTQMVAAALSERLPRLLAAHQLVAVPAGQPADLVLRCRILDLRSGSKALRVFVGYGAGKTVLRVGVTLAPAAARQASLLGFETNATTGGMPGGGFGIPAVAGEALKAVNKDGLAAEVDQTLKAIDTQLNAYFVAQGWPYAKSSR